MLRSELAGLSVQQRQAAYMMLARMVVDYARDVARHVGVPLSPKFVANCCASIAVVFDQAFPGYAAAGLAYMVVGRLSSEGG